MVYYLEKYYNIYVILKNMEEGLILSNVVLNVSERNEKGKKTRKYGEIQCVLYGVHLDKPTPIKMDKKEVLKLLALPQSSMVTLNLAGKAQNCLVKELQQSIYGKVIHIDFQGVNANEDVKLNVPVVFKGEGLLESKGLLLEPLVAEVELYGESDKFPENIEVNAETFDFGTKVFAKDLVIPEGFKLELDGEALIATVKSLEAGQADKVEDK